MRVGIGHNECEYINEKGKISFSGVEIESDKIIEKDILVETIVESIYGACGLDELDIIDENKDYLSNINEYMRQNYFIVSNIDVNLYCYIDIDEYIPFIRVNIANSLGIEVSDISIKLKTSLSNKEKLIVKAICSIDNYRDFLYGNSPSLGCSGCPSINFDDDFEMF